MKKRFVTVLLLAVLSAVNISNVRAQENNNNTAEAMEETVEKRDSEEAEEVFFEDMKPGFRGEWLTFEGKYQVYIPITWEQPELTEEEKETGVLLRTQHMKTSGWNLAILKNKLKKDRTVDDLANDFAQQDTLYRDVKKKIVNGISALSYTMADDSYDVISFPDGEGNLLSVLCGPADDDLFAEHSEVMLASVSIVEEE